MPESLYRHMKVESSCFMAYSQVIKREENRAVKRRRNESRILWANP